VLCLLFLYLLLLLLPPLLLTPNASPAIWSSVHVGITSMGPA
jgi:hypothetical protein